MHLMENSNLIGNPSFPVNQNICGCVDFRATFSNHSTNGDGNGWHTLWI